MTVVQISKKRIIKSIMEEPLVNLEPGKWVDDVDVGSTIKAKDCPVCAVGAVMRNVLSEREELNAIWDAAEAAVGDTSGVLSISSPTIYGVYCETLRDGKYFQYVAPKNKSELFDLAKESVNSSPMAALSQVFEGLCELAMLRTNKSDLSRHQKYRIRKDVVEFVQKNFPRSIQIDINGAEPAKDVKVVE